LPFVLHGLPAAIHTLAVIVRHTFHPPPQEDFSASQLSDFLALYKLMVIDMTHRFPLSPQTSQALYYFNYMYCVRGISSLNIINNIL